MVLFYVSWSVPTESYRLSHIRDRGVNKFWLPRGKKFSSFVLTLLSKESDRNGYRESEKKTGVRSQGAGMEDGG